MTLRARVIMAPIAALLFSASAACGTSEDSDSATSSGGGTSRSPQNATETSCSYVEARPTYLPWLDKGEEVPEPQRTMAGGTSYISWNDGVKSPPHQSSVILRRNSELLGGAGELVGVSLEGSDGYYYSGPSAQAAVLWKTGSEACSLITLSLSLRGADQAEMRNEILKVVDSLEN